MSNPKVSIIVPIYNVEQYLDRCLDSLVNQTFQDIEIIGVNDGSTDNSFDVLNTYAKKDKRIKVINKINEGLSKSRNRGIEASNGDYIMFVDSDDWIDKNMIYRMYKEANEDVDLVICTYTRVFENKSIQRIINDMPKHKVYDKEEFIRKIYRRLVGPIGEELRNPQYLDCLSTAWSKLYKSSLIKENEIKFIDTDIVSTEDTPFNVELFNYVEKCVFINEPLYNYWKGNSSSITTKYRERLDDKCNNLHNYIEDIISKNKRDETFYKALENRRCLSMLGLGLNECSETNKISTRDKISNIKHILENEKMEKSFSQLELKYFPVHWRIFYALNKYKLSTLIYLMLKSINSLRKYA